MFAKQRPSLPRRRRKSMSAPYPSCVARPDVSMGAEEIAAYLAGQRTATLASIGPAGFPHQVAMWFVPEPGRVVMWA